MIDEHTGHQDFFSDGLRHQKPSIPVQLADLRRKQEGDHLRRGVEELVEDHTSPEDMVKRSSTKNQGKYKCNLTSHGCPWFIDGYEWGTTSVSMGYQRLRSHFWDVLEPAAFVTEGLH